MKTIRLWMGSWIISSINLKEQEAIAIGKEHSQALLAALRILITNKFFSKVLLNLSIFLNSIAHSLNHQYNGRKNSSLLLKRRNLMQLENKHPRHLLTIWNLHRRSLKWWRPTQVYRVWSAFQVQLQIQVKRWEYFQKIRGLLRKPFLLQFPCQKRSDRSMLLTKSNRSIKDIIHI